MISLEREVFVVEAAIHQNKRTNETKHSPSFGCCALMHTGRVLNNSLQFVTEHIQCLLLLVKLQVMWCTRRTVDLLGEVEPCSVFFVDPSIPFVDTLLLKHTLSYPRSPCFATSHQAY